MTVPKLVFSLDMQIIFLSLFYEPLQTRYSILVDV